MLIKRGSSMARYPEFMEYSNTSMHFGEANMRKHYDLIRTYVRHLHTGFSVDSIRYTYYALRHVHPKAVLHTTVNTDHLAACESIIDAFKSGPNGYTITLPLPEADPLLLLVIVGLEDLIPQKAETVAMLIRRGITNPEDVRSALKDFAGISPSLVDGTL
jgi:hypothetical protein